MTWPKASKEWKSILMQEKPFVDEAIKMVLEPEFSEDEVSIIIPKSVIKKEEDGLKPTLVGGFVGVWTL